MDLPISSGTNCLPELGLTFAIASSRLQAFRLGPSLGMGG